MKKTHIALVILLALSLALCACGKDPAESSVPTTDPVPQTTEPQINVPETTEPIEKQPVETTEPEKTGPDIEGYTELLKHSGYGMEQNWVRQAMSCVFGQPEDIDLYYFFYGTLSGSWDSISEDSQKYLAGQGYHKEMDIQVRPLDSMDQIMQKVFGIKLSDVESGIPDRWRYIQAEKAYCSNHNDAHLVADFTVTWVEEYAGNRVDIFYTVNGTYYNTDTGEYLENPDMVLALRAKNDGSYQVLANLVAPTK